MVQSFLYKINAKLIAITVVKKIKAFDTSFMGVSLFENYGYYMECPKLGTFL